MDVSIIIVNYNTRELTKNCLLSIYEKTKEINFEIIVSDNGSKDGSQDMIRTQFPEVNLIENNANLGFGTANNRALAVAKGKYVFYLNSDTILLNNAVKIFFDHWENAVDKDTIGALGANLLDTQGHIIHSYGDFPDIDSVMKDTIKALYGTSKLTLLNVLFRKQISSYNQNSSEKKILGEVDSIIGADLFLKNDEHAYFDEHYFMYCEETDLQYRLARQGKKRLLIDGPKIIHLNGASSKKEMPDTVRIFSTFSFINYNLSRIYFFRKHGVNRFKIFILKTALFFIWLNPLLFSKTKRYIPKLLRT
ncbi:glycosyltransferase family 2 protein [Treponema socranskii]|uniref:glycosyltransferase family 2 protein n=1 Tax=Treponema socranskii TaxID=53419 RepID=UPI003D9140B0